MLGISKSFNSPLVQLALNTRILSWKRQDVRMRRFTSIKASITGTARSNRKNEAAAIELDRNRLTTFSPFPIAAILSPVASVRKCHSHDDDKHVQESVQQDRRMETIPRTQRERNE